MTNPEPPGGHDLSGRSLGTTPSAAISTDPHGRRRGPLVLILGILSTVLLVTTIGFGTTTLLLWNQTSAQPQPTPSPTESEGSDGVVETSVQGIPVRVVSDVIFDKFAMEELSARAHTLLYATVTNSEPDLAATAFFDVTVYAEDGTIIDRSPTNLYLLPGQTSMLNAILGGELDGAASIAIEQTMYSAEPPAFSGGVSLDEVGGGEGGLVQATFTSNLSAVAEYAEVYIVGFIDGEIYAVCSDYVDAPVNASFTADCYLDAAWDENRHDVEEFSDDAVFDAYILYDIPF